MCDVFITSFERVLEEQMSQRNICSLMKNHLQAVSSPYAFVRIEGLREALRLLTQLAQTHCSMVVGPSVSAAPHEEALTPAAAGLVDMIARVYQTPGQKSERREANSSASRKWCSLQQALKSNFSSAIFHRIFPRRDLLFNLQGAPQVAEMTHDEAKSWTTLIVPGKGAAAAGGNAQSSGFEALRSVTMGEQELALRFLQGLCNIAPTQKQFVTDSPLFFLFSETLQCLRQHIDALHQEMATAAVAAAMTEANPSLFSSSSQAVEAGSFVLGSVAAPSRGPSSISLDPALESVVIAMLDAVEAACHYNPRALVMFVSSGCVKHLLQVALSPRTPTDIRCSFLDTVSLLLQEVAPFRRAVQQSAVGAAAADVPADEDVTIAAMLNYAEGKGVGGQTSSADAPPYTMDRASASKYDSAVRQVFSQVGLNNVLPYLISLRDVSGTVLNSATRGGRTGGSAGSTKALMAMSKAETHRVLQRACAHRERALALILSLIDAAGASSPLSPPTQGV